MKLLKILLLLFLMAMGISAQSTVPTPTPQPTAANNKTTNQPVTVWKTITLGGYTATEQLKAKEELKATLRKAKLLTFSDVITIIDSESFILAKETVTIKLVKLSVSELFPGAHGARRQDIYARARERGLELCPLEVGPQLRLQYQDQPVGEVLHVAMQSVVNKDGYQNVFILTHWNGYAPWLWVDGEKSNNDFWFAGDVWVFVLPSPPKTTV